MKKLYFRWNDKGCNGVNPEWVEMTGKEFLEFKRISENKHRKFAEYIDEFQETATIVMEVTQKSYNRWHCEDVTRKRKRAETRDAGYREISMDEEICGLSIEEISLHDVVADESVDVEQDGIKHYEISRLKEALKNLAIEERELIEALFLSDNPLTEREYAERLGISQPAIHKRKVMILEKMKKYF